jgi:hypothetical protein
MGYGRPLASASRYEALGVATGTGTTVTAAATVNTFGSTVTLGTASFDYDGFFVSVQSNSNASCLVDIIINTGGSDQIIVPNIPSPQVSGGAITQCGSGLIPVRIPAGALVKAKVQSATVSATVNVSLVGFQGDENTSLGFRGLAGCTDITGSVPTNSLTMTSSTQTAPVQVQLSTQNRIAGLFWSYSTKGLSAGSLGIAMQVGWGTAGNENWLFTALLSISTLPILQGPYPCDLPAGTRLVVRAQASGTDTQTIAFHLHGLIA